MNTKKSQLNSSFNWFLGLAIIFFIGIGWMIFTKAFISMDDAITPKINDSSFESAGKSPLESINLTRRVWIAFPIVLIISVIAYMVLTSLKQDPNYPYQ